MILNEQADGYQKYTRWAGKGPLEKIRVGKFQISIWKKSTLFRPIKDPDRLAEKDMLRVCIQYSKYNKASDTWVNQCIWCEVDDLFTLGKALNTPWKYDDFTRTDEE